MNTRQHLGLLVQVIALWAGFWVLGLPAYYQQYSTEALGVASVLLSVLISLAAIYLLARVPPQARMRRAFWLSFYYTVPFAILDSLYCGMYLGHGPVYLLQYWYLTVFYVSPWLTFMPTVLLLRKVQGA